MSEITKSTGRISIAVTDEDRELLAALARETGVRKPSGLVAIALRRAVRPPEEPAERALSAIPGPRPLA